MPLVVSTVAAVAAAALSGAAVAVVGRRREAARVASARSEIESVRVRGEQSLERERASLLADARRKAEATRVELVSDAAGSAAELDAEDQRLATREAAIERRRAELEERSKELDTQFEGLRQRADDTRTGFTEVEAHFAQAHENVERAAQTTRGETLAHLTHELVDSTRMIAQKAARLREEAARANAEPAARQLIDLVCQRYGTAVTTERLATTVTLPPPGKIRERLLADSGALLHALTAATQVELIGQNDGETYFLQAQDPYAREIGRMAFDRLLKERELNEAAVVRVAAKAAADLERTVRQAGAKAAEILKVQKMHPDILLLVGKLLYRTSYTQNQWAHAIETAHLCGMMAEDLGIDPVTARRSALIHDIGKVLYAETEAVGSHAVSGAAFARDHGEPPEIVHPIAAHHNDEKPETVLAHIVAAADALSGARPGARRATDEAYSMRVEDLERICESFRGIESHFVIQGGRELRIVVDQTRLSDVDAAKLSNEVAHRIEDELTYPGQIKVTVIRETRAQAVARY